MLSRKGTQMPRPHSPAFQRLSLSTGIGPIMRQGLASASRVEVRTVPFDTDIFAPPKNTPQPTGTSFVGPNHDPWKGFIPIASLLEASPRVRAAGVDLASLGAPDPTEGVG
jgi:hypothetical protein